MSVKGSQKIIYRSPKKNVRRVWFNVNETFDSAGGNSALHTATDKETLMGYELDIVVWSEASWAAGNEAHCAWDIYVGNSGDYVAPNIGVSNLDQQESRDVVERRWEAVVEGSCYKYIIKSRTKRKLSKGQVVYLSYDMSGVIGEANIIWAGKLYIGD